MAARQRRSSLGDVLDRHPLVGVLDAQQAADPLSARYRLTSAYASGRLALGTVHVGMGEHAVATIHTAAVDGSEADGPNLVEQGAHSLSLYAACRAPRPRLPPGSAHEQGAA
jgi:hypothetical protein